MGNKPPKGSKPKKKTKWGTKKVKITGMRNYDVDPKTGEEYNISKKMRKFTKFVTPNKPEKDYLHHKVKDASNPERKNRKNVYAKGGKVPFNAAKCGMGT